LLSSSSLPPLASHSIIAASPVSFPLAGGGVTGSSLSFSFFAASFLPRAGEGVVGSSEAAFLAGLALGFAGVLRFFAGGGVVGSAEVETTFFGGPGLSLECACAGGGVAGSALMSV